MCDAKSWQSAMNFLSIATLVQKKILALRRTIVDIAMLPLSLKKKKTT
jgi:hypothetical protein